MGENNSIIWPGWETVGLLGRGSFGEVYKIQRNVFGNVEEAALKVISIPQNAGDIEEMYSDGYDEASITSTFRSHLESIVAEYSLMRKMNGSANIVNCDDIRYVQHQDGIGWDIFIKMELLTPLTKALPAQIPEETVIKLAKDMCAALELCKMHGIVHRDIKPQNIFVSPNGDYKLGDFGIAKTVEKTMGGTKIGTYKYMAPEVYNNQPYGTSADIYSLGLVLYWMLNERRLPFLPLPPEKLLSGAEEAARHRRFSGEALPPPAHGSPELKQIVLKACAYDPRVRYSTAAEMQYALSLLGGNVVRQNAAQSGQHAIYPNYAQPSKNVPVAAWGGYSTGATAQTASPNIGNAEFKPANPVNRPIAQAPYSYPVDNRQGNVPQRKKKISPFVWLASVAVVAALIIVLFTDILPRGKANNSSSSMDSGRYNDDAGKNDSANKTETKHNWIAATCTSAKTCKDCGKTEGKPSEHKWQAATCYSAKICRDCDKTEGNPLEHNWQSATRTAPKTCSRCDATEGMSLGTSLIQCSVIEDSQSSKGTDIIIGSHTSVSGRKYEDAVRFWVKKKSGFTSEEEIVYNLGGKYDLLSCSVAIDKKSDSGAEVRFYFYGDGKLLDTSGYIEGSTIDTLEIDVSGVKKLRVRCETDANCDSYGILSAMLYVE